MNRSVIGKVLLILLCLALLFAGSAEETAHELFGTVIADGSDLIRFGNIEIDIPADRLYDVFAQSDIAAVDLGAYGSFEAPVYENYDDVKPGEMLLRAVPGKDYITLAVNYGHLAVDVGLADKASEGADTAYTLRPDVSLPISVVVTFRSAGNGAVNTLGKLIRTNVREDYSGLSDEQFANFRAVRTTGMAEGILYRSSSPVDPDIGRNAYADAAAKRAGVKGFINLSDSESSASAFPGYAESYYASQEHAFLCLSMNIFGDEFGSGMVQGTRFMIENEGPYLIHCVEGKDRTGLAVAVLECLMGARLEEIIDDYVETYRNFYSVEGGVMLGITPTQEEALRAVIIINLETIFGIPVDDEAELAEGAEKYLLSAGLTPEELSLLKAKLG